MKNDYIVSTKNGTHSKFLQTSEQALEAARKMAINKNSDIVIEFVDPNSGSLILPSNCG